MRLRGCDVTRQTMEMFLLSLTEMYMEEGEMVGIQAKDDKLNTDIFSPSRRNGDWHEGGTRVEMLLVISQSLREDK